MLLIYCCYTAYFPLLPYYEIAVLQNVVFGVLRIMNLIDLSGCCILLIAMLFLSNLVQPTKMEAIKQPKRKKEKNN